MNPDRKSETTVAELMEPLGEVVAPEMSLSEGLALLAREPTHELPALEGGRLKGMFCYRVLLERRRLTSTARVDTLLLHSPRISPGTTVAMAAQRMLDGNFRLLPVLEQERVVGLVSRLGLLEHTRRWMESSPLRAEEVMTLKVEGVRPGDTLTKARTLLRTQDLLALPVLKGRQLQGIIGTRELIARGRADRRGHTLLEGERYPVGSRVEHLMDSHPVTIIGETGLAEAADVMLDSKTTSLMVARGERFEGVLTARHLLEAALAQRKPRKGVHVQVTGLSEEDPWQSGQLMDRLHQALQRLNRLEEVRSLNLHVSQYRSGEYLLRGQLQTRRRNLSGTAREWDLLAAARQFTEGLENRLRRKSRR